MHHVTEQDGEEYEDIMSVTTAETMVKGPDKTWQSNNGKLFAGMGNGKELAKFQIDCGASCNVIPVNL